MLFFLSIFSGTSDFWQKQDEKSKGYDITPTGLTPEYPHNYDCSPITSLYASWLDIDGTERSQKHSGIDAGRLNDPIIAPAPGKIKAVWLANWGWGQEGALLIEHTREELNLKGGASYYYSVFDHLRYKEIKKFKTGEHVPRGKVLAHVYRPGGFARYLPEVHFEVWESNSKNLRWVKNGYGGRECRIKGARLIDPLYMMSLERRPSLRKKVMIQPFIKGKNYNKFKGFTYILACQKKAVSG